MNITDKTKSFSFYGLHSRTSAIEHNGTSAANAKIALFLANINNNRSSTNNNTNKNLKGMAVSSLNVHG